MTFRGNLLLYSLWYELHPFENLRRKASLPRPDAPVWAERKIFTGFWVKILWAVHLPLDSQCGRLWLSMPRRQGLIRVWHPAGNEQGPAATTKRGLRNGVAPTSRRLLPGCRSAGHGATGRRDRSGRCKPGFCVRDGSPPGGDSSAGSVHDSPPRRGRPEKA